MRQSFERGLIDLRAALRRADRPAALATLKTLEEAILQAERLLEASKSENGSNQHLVLVVLLAGVAIGGTLLVWWIGKQTAVS